MTVAGVNLFNISLDTLVPAKFEFVTRTKGFDRVLAAVHDLCQIYSAGEYGATLLRPKLNVVVMKNFNEDEIGDFVELTREMPIDVRFIEFMPFNSNKWSEDRFFSYKEMLGAILTDERFISNDGRSCLQRLPDEHGSTSKAYAVEGYAGRIGFITSMSDHFCHSCNRIRITADGKLKSCLFGDEAENISLTDPSGKNFEDMQTVALDRIVNDAISKKHLVLGGHGDMQSLAKSSASKMPMIRIGG